MLVYLILPGSDTFLCSSNELHWLNKQIVTSSYLTFCIELLMHLVTKIQGKDCFGHPYLCVCVRCSELGNYSYVNWYSFV